MQDLSRRGFLGSAAAATLAAAATASASADAKANGNRRRSIRLAHITDTHMKDYKRAVEGLRSCMQHIHELGDKPDLIANTGDTVFCINGVDEADATKQWGLWTDATKDCRLPLHSAIGNHDVWGWQEPSASAPKRGKAWARELLRMPERYYRIDRDRWSFLFLDDIFVDAGYLGRLDDTQMEWLRGELTTIPKTQHICILSHIPIITACGYFDGNRLEKNIWTIPGSWMHVDAAALKDLFLKHPNVRVCLSGHMHQVERIDFNRVSYICSGAVSASWWDGKYYECDFGYGLLDLFDDGSFEYKYDTFGWKPPAA